MRIALTLALLFATACSSSESHVDRSLLEDRLWVARKHTEPRDLVPVMLFLVDEGHELGMSGVISAFRVNIDMFGWRIEGDQLTRFYPQDRKKLATPVHVRRCNEVRGFDLCLTVGSAKYYANENERIRADERAVYLERARGVRDLAP
jgi:hypothetical protein